MISNVRVAFRTEAFHQSDLKGITSNIFLHTSSINTTFFLLLLRLGTKGSFELFTSLCLNFVIYPIVHETSNLGLFHSLYKNAQAS